MCALIVRAAENKPLNCASIIQRSIFIIYKYRTRARVYYYVKTLLLYRLFEMPKTPNRVFKGVQTRCCTKLRLVPS